MSEYKASKSVKFGEDKGALKSANQAAYMPKGGSDKDQKSHGSRPSHITRPEIKGEKA